MYDYDSHTVLVALRSVAIIKVTKYVFFLISTVDTVKDDEDYPSCKITTF